MDPDEESPNRSNDDELVDDELDVATHEWLQADDAPSSWAPPPPPPPATLAPAPPSTSAAVVPLSPPTSGYGATAPEKGWDTYRPPEVETAGAPAGRADAKLAGAMLVVGAALAVLGSGLTWATFPDAAANPLVPRTFNGFTDLAGESKDGPFFVAFATILAVFGITLVLARRITGILLTALTLSAFGAAAAAIDVLDVADPDGLPASLQPSVGIGLPVVIGGFVVAFAGSVVGLVKGRRDS